MSTLLIAPATRRFTWLVSTESLHMEFPRVRYFVNDSVIHPNETYLLTIISRLCLLLAADNNRSSAADVLVDAGADIECQDIHKWTPLHCAARCETVEVSSGQEPGPHVPERQQTSANTSVSTAGTTPTEQNARNIAFFSCDKCFGV